MKDKILQIIYIILSKIPDFYQIDTFLKKSRAKILSMQSNKIIGKNVSISSNVKIWSSTKLKIGNNVKIKDNVVLSGTINIGEYSQILSFTHIDGSGGVIIGSYTQIGRENHIYSHNHDIYKKNQKVIYSKEIYKPVTIGDDVMLFSKVSVMAGVNIKNGSVIAHGSIVTKDTEEYGIYAGIPVKKVGERE